MEDRLKRIEARIEELLDAIEMLSEGIGTLDYRTTDKYDSDYGTDIRTPCIDR